MNPNTDQGKVLGFLAKHSQLNGESCWNFKGIAEHVKLDRHKVARACRALRTRKLVECHHGLWDDEGQPRGSGYCVTESGKKIAPPCNIEVYE